MASPPPPLRPRGPLPARVYWVRRLLVLGVPLALVVVLARALGGSADGKDPDQAAQVAAQVPGESTAPTQGPTAAPKPKKNGKKGKKGKPPKPVLAEPQGTCAADDIVATPDVTRIPGGSRVDININLRTRESEACTWRVSPNTFTVTITSGSDHIWSSRECRGSIKSQDVVVRQAVDAPVSVSWHARRSDEDCSRYTDWARPGYYHVQAAALGGEATDAQFRLVAPSAPVVTQTVDPKPDQSEKKDKKGKKNQPQDYKPGEDGEGNPEG